MSSHREAPEISKDPAADSTDVYAFMHPTIPDTAVLIANFIPLQQPNSGPNFFEFADDVRYEIKISNTPTMKAAISFQFRFGTTIRDDSTFLYNTGQINNISDTTWNRPQRFNVTRIDYDGKGGSKGQSLGKNMYTPPVNVGTRSTPDYAKLSDQAVYKTGDYTFFAGQRADAFFVDLGSIFDLAGLRPLNEAHEIKLPMADGVNAVQGYNVHTIAMMCPSKLLTKDGKTPTGVLNAQSVIGVWSAASRQKAKELDPATGHYTHKGPFVQVSRLANPLFNEVLVPMADKDEWNTRDPSEDSKYVDRVDSPELAKLLPVLYPGAFPNLAAYTKKRADLDAILLTGIPGPVLGSKFQNYTGPVKADVLRLNMAQPPTAQGSENPLGVVAGDFAGYPNGRRPIDNIVTIELRAIAGLTIPLVDPDYKVDDAVNSVEDGTSVADNAKPTDTFPFLNLPGGGYETMNGTTTAS